MSRVFRLWIMKSREGGSNLLEDCPVNTQSRRETERDEHRNYILRTAERLFAERGFLGVTMREIAQRAEFALGTVYRFFGGKGELYEQMIDKKVEEFVEFVTHETASGRTAREKVRKFIEAKLTFFSRNLDFVRLYFAENRASQLYGEQALTQKLRVRYEVLFERLVGVFEQGIREGVFTRADPRMLATALDGLTSALAFSWVERMLKASPSAEIETANRLFLEGALLRT